MQKLKCSIGGNIYQFVDIVLATPLDELYRVMEVTKFDEFIAKAKADNSLVNYKVVATEDGNLILTVEIPSKGLTVLVMDITDISESDDVERIVYYLKSNLILEKLIPTINYAEQNQELNSKKEILNGFANIQVFESKSYNKAMTDYETLKSKKRRKLLKTDLYETLLAKRKK